MMRPMVHRVGRLSMAIGVTCAASATAAESAPDEVLRRRGLGPATGSVYVLQAESDSELKIKLGDVRAMREKVEAAITFLNRVAEAQRNIRSIDEEIATTEHRRNALQLELDLILRNKMRATRRGSFNSVQLAQIGQLESLRDACNDALSNLRLDRKQIESRLPSPAERRKVEATGARQAVVYGEKLADPRRSTDPIVVRYDELSRDAEVARALASARRGPRSVAPRLGPSYDFRRLLRELEADERLIRVATVKTHRVDGLFRVQATFNSRETTSVVLDPGTSVTTLPASLAAQVGLKPSPADRSVRRRTDGGTTVDARQVKAASIRVGMLTFANVPCEVLPVEAGDVPPRLGKDLLRSLHCEFVPENDELILARVESSAARPGPGRSPSSRH